LLSLIFNEIQEVAPVCRNQDDLAKNTFGNSLYFRLQCILPLLLGLGVNVQNSFQITHFTSYTV